MFAAFVFSDQRFSRFICRLAASQCVNNSIAPFFASTFALSMFSSTASLSSYFTDAINGPVMHVRIILLSRLAGREASIQALVWPLFPRAVGTCGS